jgi:hypothetical protein
MLERKQECNLTVLDSRNNKVEIPFFECNHCDQLIPDVGECGACGTAYKHLKTVEDFKTGFLHYIFECSGCPEDERTARKMLKFKGEEEKNPESSKESRRKELADDFLRSGGY